jgi:hypothetical protein
MNKKKRQAEKSRKRWQRYFYPYLNPENWKKVNRVEKCGFLVNEGYTMKMEELQKKYNHIEKLHREDGTYILITKRKLSEKEKNRLWGEIEENFWSWIPRKNALNSGVSGITLTKRNIRRELYEKNQDVFLSGEEEKLSQRKITKKVTVKTGETELTISVTGWQEWNFDTDCLTTEFQEEIAGKTGKYVHWNVFDYGDIWKKTDGEKLVDEKDCSLREQAELEKIKKLTKQGIKM